MTSLLRPLVRVQEPIPGGSYDPLETAIIAWLQHVQHHFGCYVPLWWALMMGGVPLWACTFFYVTLEHREDWFVANMSVRDAITTYYDRRRAS